MLCSYEVDRDDVADLASEQGRAEFSVSLDAMASAWATALAEGRRPPSWAIHDRLRAQGVAGILVPSFAPGAEAGDRNLVLWDWGPACRTESPSERPPAEGPALLELTPLFKAGSGAAAQGPPGGR